MLRAKRVVPYLYIGTDQKTWKLLENATTVVVVLTSWDKVTLKKA